MSFDIQTIPLPPVQTNAYLVSDPDTRQALLVDAPEGVWAAIAPILEAGDLQLEGCLLTHAHFDHVLGAAELNTRGVPLFLHQEDRSLLEHLSEQMRFFGLPGQPQAVTIDRWLEDGECLTLLGAEVELRRVPGHAPGNIVAYFAEAGIAFTGDALFAGGVGRTDLPGGSFAVLEEAIRRQIYTLPPATRLYPGHGPATSVEAEMRSNPFVSA